MTFVDHMTIPARSGSPDTPLSAAAALPGRMRVAWVGVEPTPYHLPLLRRLAAEPRLDLHLFFCARQVNQQWSLEADYASLTDTARSGPSYCFRGLYYNPAILRALRREPWDAVVLGGYAQWTMRAALAVALARRIPFLILSDNQLLRPRPRLKTALKRALLFPMLRRCGAAVGVGRLAKEYWEWVGVPPQRVFTVPYCSHLDQFRLSERTRRELRDHARRELGLSGDRLVGLYVGRLAKVKGVDQLLSGLAGMQEHERPEIVIAGDGPERSAWQRLAARRSLPVRFLGARQNAELPPLYAAADFFVLPSRDEPWGIVVSEAMAAGLPVVLSSQVGAAYDLLDGESNGFLVRHSGAAAWTDALRRCLRQRAELPAMGRRSQAIAAGWTCAAAAEEFLRALDVAVHRV